MHNQNNIPLNQTQFSFEEPIFEDPTIYQEEKPVVEEVPKKSRKKLYLIIGIGAFALLLILILFILIRMRGGTQEDDPLRRDPVAPEDLGPLEQRIEESRQLLEDADPTKQDLSYPPINFSLRLDPKED